MSLLINEILRPFAMEMLFFSSLFLLIAIVAQVIFLRQSAALKHRIWTNACVGLLILPIFCLLMPRWGAAPGEEPVEESATESLVFSVPVEEKRMPPILMEYAEITPLEQPVYVGDEDAWARMAERPLREAVDEPVTAIIPFDMKPEQPEQAITSQNHGEFLFTGLLLTWFLGVITGVVFLGRSFLTIQKQLRASGPVENARVEQFCLAICRKLALHKTVRLWVNEKDQIPLVTGCFRPTILLPKTCFEWSDEKLCAVLTHELAHVKRNDIVWQILTRLAGSFYWFHPLVWIATWRIREERETACDDMVLLYGQQPGFYADVLLGIASHATGRSTRYGCAVAMARSSRIERRIRSILLQGKNRSPVRKVTVFLIGLFVLGMVSVLVAISPFTPPMLFHPAPVIAEDREPVPAETPTPETRQKILNLYDQLCNAAEDVQKYVEVLVDSGHSKENRLDLENAKTRAISAKIQRSKFLLEDENLDDRDEELAKLRGYYDDLRSSAQETLQAVEVNYAAGKQGISDLNMAKIHVIDTQFLEMDAFPEESDNEKRLALFDERNRLYLENERWDTTAYESGHPDFPLRRVLETRFRTLEAQMEQLVRKFDTDSSPAIRKDTLEKIRQQDRAISGVAATYRENLEMLKESARISTMDFFRGMHQCVDMELKSALTVDHKNKLMDLQQADPERIIGLMNEKCRIAHELELAVKMCREMGHAEGTHYNYYDTVCKASFAEIERLRWALEMNRTPDSQEPLLLWFKRLLKAAELRLQSAETTYHVGKIPLDLFCQAQSEYYTTRIEAAGTFPDLTPEQLTDVDLEQLVNQTDIARDMELEYLIANRDVRNAVYETFSEANKTASDAVSYLELLHMYSQCIEADLAVRKHEQEFYGKHQGEDLEWDLLKAKFETARREYEIVQEANQTAPGAVSDLELSQLRQKMQQARHEMEQHIQSTRENPESEKEPPQGQTPSAKTTPLAPSEIESFFGDLSYLAEKKMALLQIRFNSSSSEEYQAQYDNVLIAEREYYKLSQNPNATLDDFIKAKRKVVEEYAKLNTILAIEKNPLIKEDVSVADRLMSGLVCKQEYDILRLIKMKREKTLAPYLLGREIEGDNPDERYRILKSRCEQLKEVDINDARYMEQIRARQEWTYTKIEKILNLYERGERWKTFQNVDRIWFDMFIRSMQELQTVTQQEIDFFDRIDWTGQKLKAVFEVNR